MTGRVERHTGKPFSWYRAFFILLSVPGVVPHPGLPAWVGFFIDLS